MKKKEATEDDFDNELKLGQRGKFDKYAQEEKENKPDEKLDIVVLENLFEKWFREEDSL